MKRFLIILITLLVIFNSCATGIFADGGANAPLDTGDTINPYDNENLHFGKKHYSTTKPTINSSGVANNTDMNSYVKFDNVDFGADGARAFVLEYGVPKDNAGGHVLLYLCENTDAANKDMEAKLTSAEKANDPKIISGADLDFVTESTDGWTTYEYKTKVMTVAEAEKFKGVKDLYIAFVNAGTGNFKHFYFKEEYRNFIVDKIDDNSTNYTATASFHLAKKVNLSLVSFATDSNNMLKGVKEDDSEKEVELYDNMTFSIPKYDDAINVKIALIDKNLECYGTSVIATVDNKHTGEIKPPSQDVKEGKITINGVSKDNIVIVGLRKKTVPVGDFENYMFVTPLIPNPSNGVYEITVDPSAIKDEFDNPKFGTGFYCIDYSYFYDGDKDSKKDEVEFHFMTKADEEAIIKQLQNLNGDTAKIKNVLNTAVENNILIDTSFKKDLEYINNYKDKDGKENIGKSYAFLANQTYSSSGDIYANTKIQRILLELDNSQDVPDKEYENIFHQILEKNKDEFKIEEKQDPADIVDIYSRKYAESKNKAQIATKLHNYAKDNIIKYIDNEDDDYDFRGYFQDAVIIQTISETAIWGNVDELVKGYKERLIAVADVEDNFTEALIEEYNELSDIAKQAVCEELVGVEYQNSIAIAKAFRASFDANKDYTGEDDDDSDNNNVNQDSVSRPIVGGGGGGGFSVTKPVEKEEIPTIKPEDIQINNKIEFSDLDGYAWAEKQINHLVEKNIINGRDNISFAPADNITRAEFAKILVLTLGISTDDATVFKDVPNDSWYRPYIMAGYKYGIMTGTGNNVFNAGNFITREEAATMIYRATKKGYGNLNYTNNIIAFVDAESISDYAKDAISDLSKAGIINGNDDNYVAPKANITRAETACLIYNYLLQF